MNTTDYWNDTDRCIHGRNLASRRDNPCPPGHPSCTTRLGDTRSLLGRTSQEQILTEITLDLTSAAVRAAAGYMIEEVAPTPVRPATCDLWEAMTGLSPGPARELAEHIVANHDQVTAAVVPL